jgi:hypothetical protein
MFGTVLLLSSIPTMVYVVDYMFGLFNIYDFAVVVLHQAFGSGEIGIIRMLLARAIYVGFVCHFRRHPSGCSTHIFIGSDDFGIRNSGAEWTFSVFHIKSKIVNRDATLESDR